MERHQLYHFQQALLIFVTLFVTDACGSRDKLSDDDNIGDDTDVYMATIMTLILSPFLVPILIYLFMRFVLSRRSSLWRIYSLCLWILFWIYIIYLIIYASTSLTQNIDPDLIWAVNVICCASMPVFYIYILIECWFSNERQYIVNLGTTKPIAEYIKDIKNAQPQIIWKIICYHYETRYRTVTSRDSNGNSCTRTKAYTVRVDTYKGSTVSFQWRRVPP